MNAPEQAESVEAAAPKNWLAAVPLWARVVISAVVLALVVVIVVVAIPRASAGDAKACHDYESGYNFLHDTVAEVKAGTSTHEDARVAVQLLQSNLVEASHVADSNAVAYAMQQASDLFEQGNAGDNDSGVAFYLQANDVAKTCGDAGAPISLKH